jgi:hypothetical protein
VLTDLATSKSSTKVCRGCGNTDLVLLRSLQRKQYPDCRRVITWPLEDKRPSLIGSHRAGRGNSEVNKG